MAEPTEVSSARLRTYEDCEDAINSLFRDALRTRPDEAFSEFLRFAQRFSNLSVYNAMLLRVQQPGITAVATARKWAQHDRHPKPGAKPLVILQPFGPVLFVYALEETEGRPMDGEEANSLFASGTVRQQTLLQICKSAESQAVRVSFNAYGHTLAGFAQTGHKIYAQKFELTGAAHRWDVLVNSNLDTPSQFATLTHELGHVYCGHLGGHPQGRWLQRRDLAIAEMELEAEAVAWLVSARNGVTPKSVDYLAGYAGQTDLQRISMFSILDAANRVESRLGPARGKKRP